MSKDISKEIHLFAEEVGKGKVILDVGCGLRPFESFFKDSKYIGIDVEISGRVNVEKKPDKYYDGLNIPYKDNSFDIIICTQVLEHCIDDGKLLKEIRRTLKVGGILFLSAPFIWGEHEAPYDFRRFTSFGIKKEMENNGFKILAQKKITPGVKAVEQLVNSEINNYKNSSMYTSNPWQKVKDSPPLNTNFGYNESK